MEQFRKEPFHCTVKISDENVKTAISPIKAKSAAFTKETALSTAAW